MTGKGRTGPRERQTMSGVLSDPRTPGQTPGPVPAVADPTATAPLEPETVIVEQQALVQLSLWKRMLDAAAREFDRDDPFWTAGQSAADERKWISQQRGDRIERDRDEDET